MVTPAWQKLIWAVMFLVVVEGAIRKWLLPGFQSQVYFIKDVLLILAYIGFLGARVPSGLHLEAMNGLKILLLLSSLYFAGELFNPNGPSLLLSFVGLMNYLLYAPLAFVVPYMFSSSQDLEAKLKKYAIIMLPFAALGLVQFSLGADHWMNGYLAHDSENLRAASMFGSEQMTKARTTGTFSYIGGYTTFLTVTLYLGVGLAAAHRWRIVESRWYLLLVLVSLAAIFTTGSRGPIYSLVIATPIMLYIWKVGGLMSMRHVAQMALIVGFMYLIAVVAVPDAIDAYQYRATNSDDPIVRLFSPFTEIFDVLFAAPFIGTGMASTNGVAIAILGDASFSWLNGVFSEAETARVFQETGVIGFILVYSTRIWLVVSAVRLGVRFRTPLYAAMSGVIAAFLAQNVVLIVINNPTGGIYYWFAAGLLFAMYRLERQEKTVPRATPVVTPHRERASSAAPPLGLR
jgi:hypothetical protein